MFRFIRHRRDGLVRVLLACVLAGAGFFLQAPQEEQQAEASAPRMIVTNNAAYGKCNAQTKATKVGKFGCAVILKANLPTSSIRFLSASADK